MASSLFESFLEPGGGVFDHLASLLKQACIALGARRGSLPVVSTEGDGATVAIRWEAEGQVHAPGIESTPGLKSFLRVGSRSGAVFVDRQDHEFFDDEERRELHAKGICAVVFVPLFEGGRILGVFVLDLHQPRSPGMEQLGTLHALSRQATLVLSLVEIVRMARTTAVLAERQRMAQEIHDGIAHAFVGISMLLQRTPHAQDELVLKARRLAQHGLAEARRTVRALRPEYLTSNSFVDAVREMARSMLPEPMHFELTTTGQWTHLGTDTEAQLFRIVQEAVNNAVKHSGACQLSVDVSCVETGACILVADDGRGFDMNGVDANGCYGLLSMRERAKGIGAEIELVSAPNKGTQILVTCFQSTRTLENRHELVP